MEEAIRKLTSQIEVMGVKLQDLAQKVNKMEDMSYQNQEKRSLTTFPTECAYVSRSEFDVVISYFKEDLIRLRQSQDKLFTLLDDLRVAVVSKEDLRLTVLILSCIFTGISLIIKYF